MAETPNRRTEQQNKALHVFCRLAAEACNDAGVTQKTLFEARSIDVPVSEHSIKDIWKSVQEQMYGKKSTTELTRSEVSQVHEVVMQALGEKLGVSYIEFPSEEDK